jgi:hypothetical protein
LASTSDSYQTGCDCKKLVSEKVAKDLLKRSECVTLALRDFVFDQGPLLYIQGASGKTPRVGTIERPHIERGTQNFSPSIGKGTRTRTIDEVQALLLAEKMDEDDIPWDEIERMRWDEYHRLDIEAMFSITKSLPPEEYDHLQYDQWGRGWSSWPGDDSKHRDKGSVGVDTPRLLQPEEPDVFVVADREDEPREEPASEDLEVLAAV